MMEKSVVVLSGDVGAAASSRRPTSPSAQGRPHPEPPEVEKADLTSFSSLGSTA